MKHLILAGALALAPTLALAAPTDVSGAWVVNGDFSQMGIKYSLTCTFTDDGGKLSAPCKSDQGDVTATGKVDGDNVEFAYDTTYQGSPVHLDYKGQVQSDGSIKGSVDAGAAQGAFTASKQ